MVALDISAERAMAVATRSFVFCSRSRAFSMNPRKSNQHSECSGVVPCCCVDQGLSQLLALRLVRVTYRLSMFAAWWRTIACAALSRN
jgi:hypothetical protein